MAKKYFIADAIEHPGALRRTASKEGLLNAGKHATLSYSDLKTLAGSKNAITAKRARLALVMRGFKHHDQG